MYRFCWIGEGWCTKGITAPEGNRPKAIMHDLTPACDFFLSYSPYMDATNVRRIARFNRGQVVFLHREKDYWLTHFIPSYFPIQDRHFYPDVFYLIDWSNGWITTQNHQVSQFARLNRSFDPLFGDGLSRVLRIHL
jgi:hypothetical protein